MLALTHSTIFASQSQRELFSKPFHIRAIGLPTSITGLSDMTAHTAENGSESRESILGSAGKVPRGGH